MSIPEIAYYNAFNLMSFLGPRKIKLLVSSFKTLEDAWRARHKELLNAGLENCMAEKIINARKSISPESEFIKLSDEGIKLITFKDRTFPKLLLEISSSPAMLYVKGSLLENELCFAIVGSRKITTYGSQSTSHFSKELSFAGFTIVSGLAYGVDTLAHHECIRQNKRTIAVLGGGLDKKSIYPVSNRNLAENISSCGAIISEYPLGTPPLKQHFPARNRIISGLSKGVLVVEASISSGSLITANFSLEQNRDVFAVPGNIFSPNSAGTNNLIKLGAKLASCPADILEEFNINASNSESLFVNKVPENDDEKAIFDNLAPDIPLHIDEISKRTKMSMSSLSGLLTLMEIKGKVKNVGGMRYVIAR